MRQSNEKQNLRAPGIGPAALLLCALALAGATFAWLTQNRRVAGIAEIDAPMSLYIKSGADEDATFLDFTGIDKMAADHKDFVFAVSGDYVESFKLQLAYTTNNQFTYEIYRAETLNAYTAGCVTYIDQGGHPHYYKAIETGGPFPMHSLNAATHAEGEEDKLADQNDALSKEIYPPAPQIADPSSTEPPTYTSAQKNAWPLYRQTDNAIDVIPPMPFTNYFILRVKWDDANNNKETDIIYIAAKAGA